MILTGGKGIILSLLTTAIKLASSPSRKSSITTLTARFSKCLIFKDTIKRCKASSLFSQIMTPLPAASPSALTTVGYSIVFNMSLIAYHKSHKGSITCSGIPYLIKKSLEKVFEPSSCAAA